MGKVVVINAEVNRYEYRHSAYQLVLVDGGHGARGGRGQAVFGTSLADGRHARWERYDVLGEIKPEKMPNWAKEALSKNQGTGKGEKIKEQGGTLMEIRALTQPEQKYTYAQSMQLEGQTGCIGHLQGILPALDMAFTLLGLIQGSSGKPMNLSRSLMMYQTPCVKIRGFSTTAMIWRRLREESRKCF